MYITVGDDFLCLGHKKNSNQHGSRS